MGFFKRDYLAGAQPAGKKITASPLGVWSLALGCSVGWGAFVMPATAFLPVAGPLGTAIGMLIGAVVMLVIGMNYHYMMQHCQDSGGAFSFAKRAFGHDHAFLSAWFLILTYVAVIWANATALSLIANALFHNVFRFGYMYTIAGYDVYFGDLILPIVALLLCGGLSMWNRRAVGIAQTIFAVTLFVGVVASFVIAMANRDPSASFEPLFVPGKNPALQIISIVALAPWAFVGFESVSHSTGEFKFKPKWSFLIMALALMCGAMLYIALTEIAASALPEGYANWTEYLANRPDSGIEAYPTFFAMNKAAEKVGLTLLGISALAAIMTGLIGNFLASGKLLAFMANDGLLPKWFAYEGKGQMPSNAIFFLMIPSLIVPFLGRTAISWIVDITTIGATIVYAYVAASALKVARAEKDTFHFVMGILGVAISSALGLYFLVPVFWTVDALATESYLVFIIWSILGLFYFRFLFVRDKTNRLGKSIIVWITLFFLIFFASIMWIRQSTDAATDATMAKIQAHYGDPDKTYLAQLTAEMNRKLLIDTLIQMVLILISLAVMFSIYIIMQKREKQANLEKLTAEKNSRAKSTFLSNMSHDIRTPMNAIIGYLTLAKSEKDVPPKIQEYLSKIGVSSQHLLNLINDVLDMSRIEAGKMEAEPAPANIVETMDGIRDMFATQMSAKNLRFTVSCVNVTTPMIMFDKNRFDRILLNLISNAYKFTPEGGEVEVLLVQESDADMSANFELSVRDTGIGMSEEFAKKVFEAFERERSKTVSEVQGTGLGMSITKGFVELLGGTIDVETNLGKGTKFTAHFSFPIVEAAEIREERSNEAQGKTVDFSKMRILVVDDNEVNREIACAILDMEGAMSETAENGKLAVEAIDKAEAGYFDCVLMDVQMPVMNGYDATRAIRALPDRAKANTPIIAVSANAFAEDVEEAMNAGMDAHTSKPIDLAKLTDAIASAISKRSA